MAASYSRRPSKHHPRTSADQTGPPSLHASSCPMSMPGQTYSSQLAWTERYFLANLDIKGYSALLFLHHSNGQLSEEIRLSSLYLVNSSTAPPLASSSSQSESPLPKNLFFLAGSFLTGHRNFLQFKELHFNLSDGFFSIFFPHKL